jgi:hypothetical protein
MKHFLMNSAGEGNAGGGGAPDFKKVLEEGLRGLGDEIKKLNARIDSKDKPQPPAKKQQQEDEEDLSALILVDPAKAVQKITSRVREDVLGSVDSQATAQQQFNEKYSELLSDYPEIGNQSSELFVRAKEIMSATGTGKYDAGAMERAVLKAAAEKGLQPMKHRRKQDESDEDSDTYLGGATSSGEGRREGSRRRGSEKLPAATLAFAEAVGMNVKDPKVLERLNKTHSERRGNWNKYK